MRKLVSGLLVLAFLVALSSSVYAGGDKNQKQHKGSKGQGSVVQNQIKVKK